MDGLDRGTARRRSGDTVHARLRSVTRDDHDAVDAAFARFDLTRVDSYRAFLSAHARVLPALEQALRPGELIDGWRGRTAALAEDLHALDATLPPGTPVAMPAGDGARWGALYVVEGSRLGGVMLARQVGAGLPTAYLSAAHGPGGWRRLLAGLEEAAAGPAWIDAAITGARAVFAAYRDAAGKATAHG